MASSSTTSTTPAVQTQQQKAHSILFGNKAKTHNTQRTVEQEWYAYIAEATMIDVDAITYWQVCRSCFSHLYRIFLSVY